MEGLATQAWYSEPQNLIESQTDKAAASDTWETKTRHLLDKWVSQATQNWWTLDSVREPVDLPQSMKGWAIKEGS